MLHRCSVSTSLALALSVLGLAACAAHEDDADVGSDEGATTITPHGDDAPGKLQVAPPQGATQVAEAMVSVDQTDEWRSLGNVLGPLKVGGHTVHLAASGPDFKLVSMATAKVASNQTTLLSTAVVSPNVSGAPRTLGLEGTSANFQMSTTESGSSFMRVGYADGTHGIPVIGPSIRFFFGVNGADGTEFSIASGDVKKLDVWDVGQRRRARIVAPASRDLPDARCSGHAGEWSLEIDSVSQAISLPAGSALEVGLAPWNADAHYTLLSSITNLRTPLPTAARGAAPQGFTIARLDVNDVQLSGGGTVKGTYQVRALGTDAQGQPTEGSNILLCAPPTGTGVDLPPGKYKVITTYQTVEAGNKEDVTVVDLP